MMQTWTTSLWCVLVIVSLTQGEDEQPIDSLRSAIEAVSRRQRDLAVSRPSYYVSGGLVPNSYSDIEAAPGDELAFLAAPRHFTGEGQPENIGYGYQKIIDTPTEDFPPQVPLDSQQPHFGNSKELKKLLLDYLEDEVKGGPKKEGYKDEGFYHRRESLEPKRSLFRERAGEEHHTARTLEAMRKMGDTFQSSVPTAFRERVNDKLVDDVKERKLKLLTGALARKMEEEEEERRDREKGRISEGNSEEEYLGALRSLWDKYCKNNPDIADIEDISEADVGQILNYLENGGFVGDEDVEETRKRRYDGGYDFLTHNIAMGGWGAGGHHFKKRWNQRLDGDENQKGNFLYSLKFVSPGANREAIESLKDDDGLDPPDERDDDILLLPVDHNRRERDPLFQPFEHEAAEELFSNPSEEEYQRLSPDQQSDYHARLSRKELASLTRPNFSVREMSPITEVFLTPEKKYLYDTAIMKKRYPVTKRSSEFYASPPLLHHKNFAFVDTSETRKKNTIVTTDPRVTRELNQIFSSPTANDHSHAETVSEEPVHDKENSDKTAVYTEHLATTHAPLASERTTVPEVKQNTTSHLGYQHKSGSNEKTVEQPVTVSQAETPLDIKKKSIKWSDYFGIDRRRKKTGPNDSVNDSHATSEDNAIDDEWLLNKYHKAYATSTKPDNKRSPMHLHEHMQSKKAVLEQPFDTRVFHTDIFARTAQHEASKKSSQLEYSEQNEETRIDNMDAKLHNIEDLIVNEALKYTGAHEGTTDTKEIQEVKDKVLAQLATAYSLEKMRQALRDFKSSLLAEKMSRHNPENKHFGNGEEKKKRVAVKKEKAEEKKDEDKKKRDEGQTEESIKDVEEFLDTPNIIVPEGDMGRYRINNEDDKECPVLEEILNTCQSSGNAIGDQGQLFVPLCSLHQICYLCGPELGAPSPAACDLMFMTEADLMCLGDADCQLVARRSIAPLRRSQIHEEELQCHNSPCIIHHFLHTPLPVPNPATSSR